MFWDLRKYGRRTLIWLNFLQHILLVANKVAACSRFFCIDDTTYCIVFPPSPRKFTAPILLVMLVNCCRTCVAAFLLQHVANSGFFMTGHLRWVASPFQAKSLTCSCGLTKSKIVKQRKSLKDKITQLKVHENK